MKLIEYLDNKSDEIINDLNQCEIDTERLFLEGKLRAIMNLCEALNHGIFEDVE